MNKNIKILGLTAFLLVITLFLLERADHEASSGDLFLQGFRDQVDAVNSIAIVSADMDQPVEIVKVKNQWIVPARADFPASNAKVREVLLALVNAKTLEIKTGNPEQFHLLGLRNPDVEGSKAIQITMVGDDFSRSVIIGNLARGTARYARLTDSNQSWLIDQNPDIPKEATGWLSNEVLDISNSDISAISISHPDGETIEISRNADDSSTFDIGNIPDGRELSYATVANGIAGALSALTFDDVREIRGFEEAVTTTFDVDDGLQVIAHSVVEGEDTWVSFVAEGPADVAEKVTEINSRVAGWQYKLPSYKSGLLIRTWDDLLKTPDADE